MQDIGIYLVTNHIKIIYLLANNKLLIRKNLSFGLR